MQDEQLSTIKALRRINVALTLALVSLVMSIPPLLGLVRKTDFVTHVYHCDTPRLEQKDKIPNVSTTPSPLVRKISSFYKLPAEVAETLVRTARKYEDRVFPTHKDILAVIAIESSFNPGAHNQGAIGLMQIQFGQHRKKAHSKEALFDPGQNIRVGVAILKEYYRLVGKNREAAILAYKSGIGAYLSGELDEDYLNKFKKARSWLSNT